MQTFAGSTFLAEGTACAEPLTQENAWGWQSSKVTSVAAAEQAEEAEEAEVKEKEKGLGLSLVYDRVTGTLR